MLENNGKVVVRPFAGIFARLMAFGYRAVGAEPILVRVHRGNITSRAW